MSERRHRFERLCERSRSVDWRQYDDLLYTGHRYANWKTGEVSVVLEAEANPLRVSTSIALGVRP